MFLVWMEPHIFKVEQVDFAPPTESFIWLLWKRRAIFFCFYHHFITLPHLFFVSNSDSHKKIRYLILELKMGNQRILCRKSIPIFCNLWLGKQSTQSWIRVKLLIANNLCRRLWWIWMMLQSAYQRFIWWFFWLFCCVKLLLFLGIIYAFLSLQDGYRDMMKLADNFAAFNQRLKYAHFRPLVPVKADSRSWLKYAYKAVSDQMKKARYLNTFWLCSQPCALLVNC